MPLKSEVRCAVSQKFKFSQVSIVTTSCSAKLQTFRIKHKLCKHLSFQIFSVTVKRWVPIIKSSVDCVSFRSVTASVHLYTSGAWLESLFPSRPK